MGMNYLASMLWLSSLTSMLLVYTTTTASDLQLVNNGFEGILIAIDPSIDEAYAKNISLIQGIKDAITKGSNSLFVATRNRAFFRKVNILIPNSWGNTVVEDTVTSKFRDSHIHIQAGNSIYREQPYTQQNQQKCGKQGEFINLAPTYLTNDRQVKRWGRRDKNIAVEWAKFRWGIFDEIGYAKDTIFPLFHPVHLGEEASVRWLPNFCINETIKGRNIDKNTKDTCTYNKDDGKPDDNCRFITARKGNSNAHVKSSLLSYTSIMTKAVSLFCDDNTHNKDAPTKQNAFCNKRSAWSVIMDHEDFKNNRNPPTSVKEEPQFQIVQQSSHINYVFVLDYSGSMTTEDRNIKLQDTTRQFINFDINEGNDVAIVKFSSTASTQVALTKLTTSNKEGIANNIDSNATGGTCIGCGLEEALRALNGKKNCLIYVLTDGEENEDPRIATVIPKVVSSGCKVVTIAFGPNAAAELEDLAKSTGGKAFSVKDGNEAVSQLADAFDFALDYEPEKNASSVDIKIYEEIYDGTNTTYTKKFDVDMLGKNLELRIVTDNVNHITTDPFLIGPDGSIYRVTAKDYKAWIVQVKSAGIGTWKYEVGLSGDSGNYISTQVTCQPVEGGELPITITATTTGADDDIDLYKTKVVINAEVKQGSNPVIGADVRAIVSSDNIADINLELQDEGNDPDAIKGDGIYSKYLTGISNAGRLSIKIKVKQSDESIILQPKNIYKRRKRYVDFDDTIELPEEIAEPCCGSYVPQERFDAKPTGDFNRIESAGSVKITRAPPSDEDIYPPSRVGDLTVKSTETNSSQESGLAYHTTLLWTAPGDDMDTGTVDKYSLRFSVNQADLSDDSFSSATEFPLSKELYPDIYQKAGTKISLKMTLDLRTFKNNVPYYFALKAQDEKNNESPASNIVKVITPLSTPFITINNITSSYLHITWTGKSHLITKYDVTWASNSDDFISIELGPDANSLGIRGLRCNTQYTITVTARSDQDIKNWDNFASVNLTTYDTAPGLPIIKNIEPNKDHKKLIVQWSEAEYSCSGGLRNYHITWKTDNGTLYNQTLDDETKVGSTYNYAISDVHLDSTYKVTVAATSNTGILGPMQLKTVDTLRSELSTPGRWILCNCDVKRNYCDKCWVTDASSKSNETRNKRSPQPLAQLMSPSKRMK